MDKIKEAVKEAIQEPLKKFKEEISKSVDEKVKNIEEKVSKIESLPVKKVNINVIETTFKGYKLEKQAVQLREKAQKNSIIHPVFAEDEKFFEYAKFMINLAKALKGDYEAKAELKKFYQKAALQEGTGSEGGYLVPEAYAQEILAFAREQSFALQFCRIVPMSEMTRKFPKEATKPQAYWVDEEASITESEGTFGQVTLTAKKLAALAVISNELLQDTAFDLVGFLTEQFAEAIGAKLDYTVLNGDGSPAYGILSGQVSNSVQLGSGKTNFSDITADALSEMISKIPANRRTGARFFFHRTIMHYIRTLKDSNNNYIYAKPGNGVPPTIWEYPYTESEQAPSSSAANTPFVAFGDLRYYLIGRRQGQMEVDIDPYGKFDTDQTRFRVKDRLAPNLAMPDAFCRLLTAAS